MSDKASIVSVAATADHYSFETYAQTFWCHVDPHTIYASVPSPLAPGY